LLEDEAGLLAVFGFAAFDEDEEDDVFLAAFGFEAEEEEDDFVVDAVRFFAGAAAFAAAFGGAGSDAVTPESERDEEDEPLDARDAEDDDASFDAAADAAEALPAVTVAGSAETDESAFSPVCPAASGPSDRLLTAPESDEVAADEEPGTEGDAPSASASVGFSNKPSDALPAARDAPVDRPVASSAPLPAEHPAASTSVSASPEAVTTCLTFGLCFTFFDLMFTPSFWNSLLFHQLFIFDVLTSCQESERSISLKAELILQISSLLAKYQNENCYDVFQKRILSLLQLYHILLKFPDTQSKNNLIQTFTQSFSASIKV
jgi:hypothetical protein